MKTFRAYFREEPQWMTDAAWHKQTTATLSLSVTADPQPARTGQNTAPGMLLLPRFLKHEIFGGFLRGASSQEGNVVQPRNRMESPLHLAAAEGDCKEEGIRE